MRLSHLNVFCAGLMVTATIRSVIDRDLLMAACFSVLVVCNLVLFFINAKNGN